MIQEITEYLQKELHAILKKVYQYCFQKWQRHWERCIDAGGEYFEGDKAHSVAGMSKKNYKKNSSKTF
jgi:cation transport regulator ChaB